MMSIREQIRSMLRVEPREAGFRALFNISPDLTILPDHFDGAPILPGMCMVQAVLLAGAMSQGLADLQLRVLKNAKMMQPILPGEEISIDADLRVTAEGHITIKAKLVGQDRRRAEISLLAQPMTISVEALA